MQTSCEELLFFSPPGAEPTGPGRPTARTSNARNRQRSSRQSFEQLSSNPSTRNCLRPVVVLATVKDRYRSGRRLRFRLFCHP
jgi:hypothetical protein